MNKCKFFWFIPKCIQQTINVDKLIYFANKNEKFLIYIFKNNDVIFKHKKQFFKKYENINFLKFLNKTDKLTKYQFSELFESLNYDEKIKFKWINFYYKYVGLSKNFFIKLFYHVCYSGDIKIFNYFCKKIELTLYDIEPYIFKIFTIECVVNNIAVMKYFFKNLNLTREFFTKKKLKDFIFLVIDYCNNFKSFEYFCNKMKITKNDFPLTKTVLKQICNRYYVNNDNNNDNVKFIHLFHKKIGFTTNDFKKTYKQANSFIVVDVDVVKYFHKKLKFTKKEMILDHENIMENFLFCNIAVPKYVFEKMKVTKKEIKSSIIEKSLQAFFKVGNYEFFEFLHEMVGLSKKDFIDYLGCN